MIALLESDQSTEFAGGIDKPSNPEEPVVDSKTLPNPKPEPVVRKWNKDRKVPEPKKLYQKSKIVNKAMKFMLKYEGIYFTPSTLGNSAKLNINTLRRILPELARHRLVSVSDISKFNKTQYHVTQVDMKKFKARTPESRKLE